MNPYEQDLDAEQDDELLYGDEDDEDFDELIPFEDQDALLDEDFQDGKIHNYSGQKPQEPQKP